MSGCNGRRSPVLARRAITLLPSNRVTFRAKRTSTSAYHAARYPGSLRATVDMRGKRRFSDADVERARLLHHYRGDCVAPTRQVVKAGSEVGRCRGGPRSDDDAPLRAATPGSKTAISLLNASPHDRCATYLIKPWTVPHNTLFTAKPSLAPINRPDTAQTNASSIN